MFEVQPPSKLPKEKCHVMIFLAGTIDDGKGIQWQREVVKELEKYPGILLNPRRDSWAAPLAPKQLQIQINWELDGLEQSELILLFLAPGSKSPITLLELGLFAKDKHIVVCCPEGFWRKSTVDAVCRRYSRRRVGYGVGIEQVATLKALCNRAKKFLKARYAQEAVS